MLLGRSPLQPLKRSKMVLRRGGSEGRWLRLVEGEPPVCDSMMRQNVGESTSSTNRQMMILVSYCQSTQCLLLVVLRSLQRWLESDVTCYGQNKRQSKTEVEHLTSTSAFWRKRTEMRLVNFRSGAAKVGSASGSADKTEVLTPVSRSDRTDVD